MGTVLIRDLLSAWLLLLLLWLLVPAINSFVADRRQREFAGGTRFSNGRCLNQILSKDGPLAAQGICPAKFVIEKDTVKSCSTMGCG
jgi:hypothetical protein